MKFAARLVALPLLAAAAPAADNHGNPLPKASPFQPAGAVPTQAAAANETIEFAGVSTIGKKTELIFKNKASSKTSWLVKGDTRDGITLLNYDAAKEQAVVKHNGVEKVLSLRKATSTAAGPKPVAPLPTGFNVPSVVPAAMPAPTPVQAQAPLPANPAAVPQTEQQKQETEARMLVSDLLEIGMAQRKAYEDAQRKAAEGGNAQPAPAEPAPKQP